MNKKIPILTTIVIILILAVGWVVWKYAYPEYKIWKFQQNVLNMTKGIENYLAKDTYGGKTPEETYNLYLAALKRGDLETASKYFYWDREVGQKKKLEDLKIKGELEKYINDLPEWEKLKEGNAGINDEKLYTWTELLKESFTTKIPDGAGGYLEHTFKPGEYNQEIRFIINKSANIWKIYSL